MDQWSHWKTENNWESCHLNTHTLLLYIPDRETRNTGPPASALIGQQNNVSWDDSPSMIQCHSEQCSRRWRHTYVVCVFVRVIDIQWAFAETFPYEIQDSPEESTCETPHPAEGCQMCHSPFDPKNKQAFSCLTAWIWDHPHFFSWWLTMIYIKEAE